MALWADPQRLLLSTLFQVWRFENVVPPGQNRDGSDRHYIPRHAHTTGDLAIHNIGVMEDGRIIFVNTLFSCLATMSVSHSFKLYWKPPFISKLAAEDRCHLNGMAMLGGKPAHVTAVSRSDVVNGWRDRRAEGGCLIDIATNKIVTEKLSMPHSPRWHGNRLWVLNSGTGHLGTINLASGASARFLSRLPARPRLSQRPRHRRTVAAARRLLCGACARPGAKSTRRRALVRGANC